MECKTCEKPHLINNCPLNNLVFRDPKAKYIPTKEEYENYILYLKGKKIVQDIFYADIRHYRSFFSKKFNNLEDVIPYAQKAMCDHFANYYPEIIGQKIKWTKM
jgi:hypothetical protein